MYKVQLKWYNIITPNKAEELKAQKEEVIIMMNTTRVYGRKVNIHTTNGWVKVNKFNKYTDWDMCEVEYTDYDENGNIHGAGTEDFSKERFNSLRFGTYELRKEDGRTATGRIRSYSMGTYRVGVVEKDYAKGIKAWKKAHSEEGIKIKGYYINRSK